MVYLSIDFRPSRVENIGFKSLMIGGLLMINLLKMKKETISAYPSQHFRSLSAAEISQGPNLK